MNHPISQGSYHLPRGRGFIPLPRSRKKAGKGQSLKSACAENAKFMVNIVRENALVLFNCILQHQLAACQAVEKRTK